MEEQFARAVVWGILILSPALYAFLLVAHIVGMRPQRPFRGPLEVLVSVAGLLTIMAPPTLYFFGVRSALLILGPCIVGWLCMLWIYISHGGLKSLLRTISFRKRR